MRPAESEFLFLWGGGGGGKDAVGPFSRFSRVVKADSRVSGCRIQNESGF